MARIGVLSLYVPGHVHPALALSAYLTERGHHVAFFNLIDVAPSCERAGVRHVPYGAESFPAGAVAAAQARMGTMQGQAAFAFFLERMGLFARAAFAELPALLAQEQPDLLIVDQLYPGGSTIAEHAALPFVSLAAALMVNREDGVPPPIFTWPYDPSPEAVARNRQGWAGVRQAFQPLLEMENEQRDRWGLTPHSDFLEDSFSPLLQLAQQPPSLEFPRRELPAHFHMVGPLRRAAVFPPAPFPFDRLDGRPLVYASFGTLQNGLDWLFRVVFEAVDGLDVQAVVSLGNGALVGSEALGPVPANVLVLPYVPQLELLPRTSLAITHAGLNTVTDCLAAGVPMVAMPIASEQPGIAARIAWTGTGLMLPLPEVNPDRLRAAVLEVLGTASYRERAREHAARIATLHPLEQATQLIEQLL